MNGLQEASDTYWARRALGFVDAIDRVNTPGEVASLLAKEIEQAGFHAYLIIGLPESQTSSNKSFKHRILAKGWPIGWTELYVKEGLAEFDPVPRYAAQTMDPFKWSEAPYDPVRERQADYVIKRAVDFQLAEGFCVPIHTDDGPGSVVSLGGERPELTRSIRSAMHLISLYSFHRMKSLLKTKKISERVLSPRERDILAWIATGLTSAAVAEKLGLSETTVLTHITSAQRKLNAPNRIATVVAALRRGEITL
jgi:LuxR family quorum sensing-dependent transcriptional regulator